MPTVLSVDPKLPLREQLRAFVDAYATTGKPSFSVTAHGELQLDWPGCERMSVIEQVLAIMAAIQPEQVLGWLETEAAAQLQLPDGQDNVSVATLQ